MPQWARMIRAPGCSCARRRGGLAEVRDAAARVEEHGRPALAGDGDDPADDGVRQAERVAARMELDPARARVQAAQHLVDGAGGLRVDPAERLEAAAGARARGEDGVVGRRGSRRAPAWRRASARSWPRGVEAVEDVLRHRLVAVGVVVADVRVRVEPRQRIVALPLAQQERGEVRIQLVSARLRRAAQSRRSPAGSGRGAQRGQAAGGVQVVAQPGEAEPDPALRGAERHADAPRDLVGGQPAPVGEDDAPGAGCSGSASRASRTTRALARRARPSRRDGPRARGSSWATTSFRRSLARPATWRLAPQVQRAAARHEAQVAAELAPARVELLAGGARRA